VTTKVSERLELGPHAAGDARRAVARLEGELSPELVDDLRLLVTELVTNSFRHGGMGADGVALLTVEVDRFRVHVEVRDRGKGFSARPPRDLPINRDAGWGLTIVERMADRWGVVEDGATTVWFDLANQPASSINHTIHSRR
jgi:anti-sigma regulatory factor (Ser/Thr protein kinase)